MSAGLKQLEIRGADIKNARSAEQHIKVLLEKAQFVFSKSVFPTYIVLDTREDAGEGVLYEKAETWWPNHIAHPIVPRLIRCAMTSSEPGEYWQDLQPAQHYEIQSEIQRALDVARYETGTHDFSIRLGCLAIKQAVPDIGGKLELSKFLSNMTENRNSDLVVKNWYALPSLCCTSIKLCRLYDDEDGEDLLTRLISATHLLALSVADGSEDWSPVLRGTWVFQDPSASQFDSSPYVVQIFWMIDECRTYEKRAEHTKYYRLDSGRIAPKENVDIKLLELGE